MRRRTSNERVVRLATTAALISCAALVGGCARPRPAARPEPAAPPFSLTLAGEYILPRDVRAESEPWPIGGISGLTQEAAPGVIVGVSDARDRPRAYVFEVSGEGASFRVRPTRVIPLGGSATSGAAEPEPPILDFEAVAVTADGLLVTTEGDADRDPRLPTGVLWYDREGRYRGQCALPPAFATTPTGQVTTGTRRNEGFESLAVAPGEDVMFAGAESPLAQDDERASLERGGRTRILEYRRAPGTPGDWRPGPQFVYALDPAATGDFQPTFFINGLVELIALNDHDLLALERSYAEGHGGQRRNRNRVYRVSLSGATDVSGATSRGDVAAATPATKQLVLDLDDVRGLSPQLAALDNFEGMTFGPQLSDGSRSLILVSDDNFSERQVTAFLQFRVVPAGTSPRR